MSHICFINKDVSQIILEKHVLDMMDLYKIYTDRGLHVKSCSAHAVKCLEYLWRKDFLDVVPDTVWVFVGAFLKSTTGKDI